MRFRFIAIILVAFIATLPLIGEAMAQAPTPAVATEGLTQEQLATLAQQAATMQLNNSKKGGNILTSPEKLSEYAKIGEDLGRALAATAREMGQEVNTFAKSPIGILAIVLLVWKLIGFDLIGVIFGMTFWFIGNGVWIYMYRRLRYDTTINLEPVKGEFFRKKTIEKHLNHGITEAELALYWVTMLIINLVAILIIFV